MELYKKYKKSIFTTTFLWIALFPAFVFSAGGEGGAGLENPIKSKTLFDFVSDILAVVRNIGFYVAIFFIVYSGFLFVTASGVNPVSTMQALALYIADTMKKNLTNLFN